MDESQILKIQVERLKRELLDAQSKEAEARKEAQQLESMLETVVYVLAIVANRGI